MAVLQYLMMGRSGTDRQVITGELHVYGKNVRGQAGVGDDVLVSDPQQIGSLTDWQNTMQPAYANNTGHVKADGTLWMAGRNIGGILGLGDTTARSSPTQVGSLTDWKELAFWGDAAGAVKTDGTLWTWGSSASGQLGHGDSTARSSPTQVGSLTDWAHVVSDSAAWMIAMKTDGTIWRCGDALGGLTGGAVSSPVQVGSESGFADCVGGAGTIFFWKEA